MISKHTYCVETVEEEADVTIAHTQSDLTAKTTVNADTQATDRDIRTLSYGATSWSVSPEIYFDSVCSTSLTSHLGDCRTIAGDGKQSTSTHVTQPSHTNHAPQSSLRSESLVTLRDLALFHRKEFKIHGGQIGDNTADISYSNIYKQIDEGLKEQHTESEII